MLKELEERAWRGGWGCLLGHLEVRHPDHQHTHDQLGLMWTIVTPAPRRVMGISGFHCFPACLIPKYREQFYIKGTSRKWWRRPLVLSSRLCAKAQVSVSILTHVYTHKHAYLDRIINHIFKRIRLKKESFFLVYFLIILLVFTVMGVLHACNVYMHTCLMPTEASRRCWIPWNWSYRQ